MRAKFLKIDIASEIVSAPATFPHVSIIEADNSVYIKTQDSGSIENHSSLMYEVNIYSNKKTGKRTECKAIFAALDEVFAKLGFTRTMGQYVPNMADLKIYRMTGRYTAVVSKDRMIYRR